MGFGTLKGLVYPGTRSGPGVAPTFTDFCNALCRALVTSGIAYSFLQWAAQMAPEIPNPLLASATLAVVHLLTVLYLQYVHGPDPVKP